MRFEPVTQLTSAWSGVARRCALHLFEGALTVGHMDQLQVHGDRWHKQNPGKLVELVIVYPSDARMTAPERTRMTELMKRWQAQRVASSTVILADGLRGAMQRSVLTGLILVVPPPHPAKVHGSVADAVAWLLPHARSVCGADLTPSLLSTAVTDFCRAFEARSERAAALALPATGP